MAYDSAAATDAAARAYQRTIAIADTNRAQLNSQYGLLQSGGLDANNRLGSIYQGNLDSVGQMHGAEMADRARGFLGTRGGLAGKHQAATRVGALDRQASGFRDATQGIAQTEQAKLFGQQDYEGAKTQIASTAAADLAETLRQNQILADEKASQAAMLAAMQQGNAQSAAAAQAATSPAQQQAMQITGQKSLAAAIAKNPRIFQTIKNRY